MQFNNLIIIVMKTSKIYLLLVFPVILFSCNSQQNRSKEVSKDTTKNAMLVENAKVEGGEQQSDEDFVKEAASGGLMEVELGRYAQQNATNPRVKNFGAMMVKDHSKANEELRSIATSKNITMPAAMMDKQQNTVNDLQKKGADFDKEYMKEMVDDHEKDVDKFQKMAENGKDPDLKAFAAKTVSILLMHQDSAKSIRDALK